MRAIGIDAIEIERIQAAIARHGEQFMDRICTPAERALAGSGEKPLEFYAGRFAAKEAVLKVLGTGWARGLGFLHVEVLRDGLGKPYVVLHGPAFARARELGFDRIEVSITHTRRDAIAVAAC